MIRSILLQSFPASQPPAAHVLGTRSGGREIIVGCCVTGVEQGRPVFEGAGEQMLDALFERAGQVKVVILGSAFECPIRFHQELQKVPADTALCFAFADTASLEEALPLLRPQYTGGAAELMAARAA